MDNIIQFESKNVKITPFSIEFANGTTWEEARQIGIQLLKNHDKMQFYIGDWILFCTGISQWGKKYEQALEKTDYAIGTLWQYVVVAKRFPPTKRGYFFERSRKCSWMRLAIVASCTDEEIEYLFTRSDTKKWSCARLREEVQKLKSPVRKFKDWFFGNQIENIPFINRPVRGQKYYLLMGAPELPQLPAGEQDEPTQ